MVTGTPAAYDAAVAGPLAKYVDAFVDGVAAELGELSGRPPATSSSRPAISSPP